jgi:DNA ligase D-like protein (predicted 3'-phosphoesterase)
VPEEPGIRRLAIQVDDHILEIGDFEGTIPAGVYGAGTIEIWEAGDYTLHEWSDDKIAFALNGNRLAGRYVMIRFEILCALPKKNEQS